MKIITSVEHISLPQEPLVVALGNFDGVHLGHQQLLNMTAQIAKKIGGKSLVFTFYPHPQLLFTDKFQMLNTFEIKTKLIGSLGIDYTLIIPFTRIIAQLSPREFFEKILKEKLRSAHLVAGFNYSFGFQGRGKAEDLVALAHEHKIGTTIMEPILVGGEIISSTRIRNHLQRGEIKKAATLLGYNPVVEGHVVTGKQFGRTIGFPTANLAWNRDILIPGNGVYLVAVIIKGERKYGVLNIGYRPTVDATGVLTMEVNIFDFNEEIYGQNLQIEFIEKLRDERKFIKPSQLQEQITRDIIKAQEIINKSK